MFDKTVRREIRDLLEARGQQAVVIRRLWFSWKVFFGRGLSNVATAYRVTARSADGALNRYTFAHDPIGAGGERPGLKRHSHGVWFDAR